MIDQPSDLVDPAKGGHFGTTEADPVVVGDGSGIRGDVLGGAVALADPRAAASRAGAGNGSSPAVGLMMVSPQATR